jgi:hypothetical protein
MYTGQTGHTTHTEDGEGMLDRFEEPRKLNTEEREQSLFGRNNPSPVAPAAAPSFSPTPNNSYVPNGTNGTGTQNMSRDNQTDNLRRRHTEPLSGSSARTGTTENLNKPANASANAETTALATMPAAQPVLSGKLSSFSPSSLLSLLNIQKQSGYLRLKSGAAEGFIYVDKGEVFDAGLGRVSSGALAVFQLFGWRQGDFSFEIGAPAPERRTIEASLPVLQVRATLWLDSMNKYSAIIPTPNHRVAISPDPRSEVVIEPYQWAVLTKIVSRAMSISELSAELGQDLMTVTRITAELVKTGVAVIHPPSE